MRSLHLFFRIVAIIPSSRKEFRDVWSRAVRMAHFVRDIVVRWQTCYSSALTDAPNPGFARAVPSLEVVVTSIVGYFIVSNSHVTLKHSGMVLFWWVRLYQNRK
jgi:hypothetical protein